VPSALHLDFFAAAKPSRLGTARGKVTLLLSLINENLRNQPSASSLLEALPDISGNLRKDWTALDGTSPALPS
jgi:hypothetical protein